MQYSTCTYSLTPSPLTDFDNLKASKNSCHINYVISGQCQISLARIIGGHLSMHMPGSRCKNNEKQKHHGLEHGRPIRIQRDSCHCSRTYDGHCRQMTHCQPMKPHVLPASCLITKSRGLATIRPKALYARLHTTHYIMGYEVWVLAVTVQEHLPRVL